MRNQHSQLKPRPRPSNGGHGHRATMARRGGGLIRLHHHQAIAGGTANRKPRRSSKREARLRQNQRCLPGRGSLIIAPANAGAAVIGD